jgi:hypothetical protein
MANIGANDGLGRFRNQKVPKTDILAPAPGSLQTSEEYDVKVHTDINVEAGMSHLTKLFLADMMSGKRLFGKHHIFGNSGTTSSSNGQ